MQKDKACWGTPPNPRKREGSWGDTPPRPPAGARPCTPTPRQGAARDTASVAAPAPPAGPLGAADGLEGGAQRRRDLVLQQDLLALARRLDDGDAGFERAPTPAHVGEGGAVLAHGVDERLDLARAQLAPGDRD